MASDNRAPMHPVRLGVAALPPRLRMRGHHHAAPHLCALLNGGLAEQTLGSTREWGENWIRISGPGTEHDIRVAGPAARCLVIEFPELLLPRAWRGRPGSTFVEAPTILRLLRSEVVPHARRYPFAALPPCEAIEIESWLGELLARLARAERIRRDPAIPVWMARARERLDVDPTAPPSLTDLAREVGVHPSHLARAFHEHFGRTIGAHVRARRLRLACRALEQTDEPISEIAVTSGFADQAHLTRAFTARWGIPPARWRRRSRR